MVASDIYNRYIVEIERNSVNEAVASDRGRFVELFNNYAIRFVEYCYEKKNEDDIRYIQSLRKLKEISGGINRGDYTEFPLPKDYFDFSNLKAKGHKKGCNISDIVMYEIKGMDTHIALSDSFLTPDFNYREGLYSFGDNNILAYHLGKFEYNSVILDYYKYPNKIRLEMEDNPESPFDDSYEIDLDDKAVGRIIHATASGFMANNGDPIWQVQNSLAKAKF